MTAAIVKHFLPQRLAVWRKSIRHLKRLYRDRFGRPLRLLRPRTYTEKMQWRKLFDLNSDHAVFSDKLAVRDFIAARIGGGRFPRLLWCGDDPDAIPFDHLDPPYVIKSTHGSGQVIRVAERGDVDIADARARCAAWLSRPYGLEYGEPGYQYVPRRIIIERMLRGPDGGAPTELRVFTFDGRARLIQSVFVRDGSPRHGAFHDPDWQRRYWYLESPPRPDIHLRPERLDELIALAEQVAEGYDHLRVDFFEAAEGLRIGEITLYSWSGLLPFRPREADDILGSYWTITAPVWRALKAVLWQRREIRPPARAGAGAPGKRGPAAN